MSQTQSKWTLIGHILRPQGRRGEMLADLLTDFPERFEAGGKVYLTTSIEIASDASPSEVVSSWLPVGRNQGRIVLGIRGVESIEAAERLAGMDIVVPEEERLDLSGEAVYTSDLIGCKLYDKQTLVGTISEVQFMTTPDGKRKLTNAAPLLAVDRDGTEVLVPFAKEFLLKLDIAQHEIHMNLPEGLVDLNSKKL